MLKCYLGSIFVWMMIIWCTILMYKKEFMKKLEKYEIPKEGNLFKTLGRLFVVSAVPFIRVLIEIVIVYMAACKQEDFDKLMEKYYEEDLKGDN